ncbi:MAG: hypothetical protein HYU67_08125 [Flavobacteriia bacterium]|nr:hypothetical protein [Flavobacteriia bacterium]
MIHKNVLIITSWSFNDALIQTYTLPYVEMISKQLSKDSKIFLVTLDREKSKNLVLNPKINLISFDYYPLGFKGIVMWLKLLFGLKRLIYKELIVTSLMLSQ